MKQIPLLLLVFIMIESCTEIKQKAELPIYGREKIQKRMEGDQVFWDTIPHRIADFAFFNQDSALITNETFEGKVYVADFFFTSCPTICPVMKQQLLRVYDVYKDNPQVAILSHTIDPEYDTIALLREFALRLGVSSTTWHFVTGDKEIIYEMGETSYMVVADEDADAPGGFVHSGALLLVDQDRRIRGVYDGTEPEQVALLINDIQKLIKVDGK